MEQQQQQQQNQQNQQQDMEGFSLELASQALAATGSKSTLKATEWILNQRRAADLSNKSNHHHNAIIGKGAGGSQSKLDLFFQSANHTNTSNALPLRSVPDDQQDRAASGGVDLDETDSNSSADSRDDSETENALSGVAAAAAAEAAVAAATTGGHVRAAIVGGYDSGVAMPLVWRSMNSMRAEQEGVGSSGHGSPNDGGGRVVVEEKVVEKNPRLGLERSGSLARGDEEALPGAFTKVKRALLPNVGSSHGEGESGSLSKRRKEHRTEAPTPTPAPAQPVAPIFFAPQSVRTSSSKQRVNNNAGSVKPVKKSLAPLAERMRPVTMDDVVGQDLPRQILRKLLDNDTVPSIILFGPPGTGKTSMARAIARSLPSLKFVGLSAVHSGTKEVRVVLEEASKLAKRQAKRTLLFLDEVHRFNKAQQDLFLPAVESGSIIFIGATTENPSFEINAALLSRCRVLPLYKLEAEHIRKVLERAIADRDRGVLASLPERVSSTAGDCIIRVEEEALTFLAGAADGDARVALNAMEVAITAAYSEIKLPSSNRPEIQDVAGTVPTCRSAALERTGSAGGNLLGSGKKDALPPRTGNGFGANRLEALIGSAIDCSQSNEDYTKPFKRFVGGKEITPVHNSTRFEREVAAFSPGDGGKDHPLRGVVDSTEPLERRLSNPDAIVPDGGGVGGGGGGGAEIDVRGEAMLVIRVTLVQAREAFQRSHILYDKNGEEHYNVISALHKSMRGGDADAAIYWLAKMLEGGEGPLYVARRLIRFASEDVGLADPHAMGVAVACYQACHFLGMPECNVNLAQCVVYLAFAPKSVVVYQAIEAAQKLIRETHQNEPVPLHLRNAPTRLMKEMGYGKGYVYPPGHTGRVEQDYMPPSLQGHKFLQWPDMND